MRNSLQNIRLFNEDFLLFRLYAAVKLLHNIDHNNSIKTPADVDKSALRTGARATIGWLPLGVALIGSFGLSDMILFKWVHVVGKVDLRCCRKLLHHILYLIDMPGLNDWYLYATNMH